MMCGGVSLKGGVRVVYLEDMRYNMIDTQGSNRYRYGSLW